MAPARAQAVEHPYHARERLDAAPDLFKQGAGDARPAAGAGQLDEAVEVGEAGVPAALDQRPDVLAAPARGVDAAALEQRVHAVRRQAEIEIEDHGDPPVIVSGGSGHALASCTPGGPGRAPASAPARDAGTARGAGS